MPMSSTLMISDGWRRRPGTEVDNPRENRDAHLVIAYRRDESILTIRKIRNKYLFGVEFERVVPIQECHQRHWATSRRRNGGCSDPGVAHNLVGAEQKHVVVLGVECAKYICVDDKRSHEEFEKVVVGLVKDALR